MINLFGEYGGFEKFRNRILKGDGLNVSIIAAMIRWYRNIKHALYDNYFIRPFGLCADFLSPMCVEKYIVPVVVSSCTCSYPISSGFRCVGQSFEFS